jgi:carboxypeptidase family protein
MRPTWVLLCLLATIDATAAGTSLRVASHHLQLRACSGKIMATKACERPPCERREFPFSALADASDRVALPDGTWTVVVDSAVCWAPETSVGPGGDPILRVWPAAQVTALTKTADSAALQQVDAWFRAYDDDSVPLALHCGVSQSRLTCRLPAAEGELRLSSAAYAPHYISNLNVAAGASQDLGSIEFAPGASLAGRLDIPSGKRATYAVELAASPHKSVARRVTLTASSGTIFQFTNVPPGRYAVTVRRPGYLPTHVDDIQVAAGHETFLPSTIKLARAGVVETFITPAMFSDEQRWVVRLSEATPATSSVPIAESQASAAGEWRNDTLRPGKYVLTLLDPFGSVFLQTTVDAATEYAPRLLTVSKTRIEGIVRAGNTPFAARLFFTDDDAARIALQTRPDGHFDGILPHDGPWSVQVRTPNETWYVKDIPVDVKRSPQQAVASVDVAVPGGKARGQVKSDTGEPIRGDVIVFRNRKGIGDALVLEDGTFEVGGLEPGPVLLQAVAGPSGESEMTAYLVAEDSPQYAQLVVHKTTDVHCWLISEEGAPVAGAIIRYSAAAMQGVRQAVSGPTGEFSLRVPGTTRSVLAGVAIPGFPATIVAIDPQVQETQRILLTTRQALLHVVHAADLPWPTVTIDGSAFLPITALMPIGPEGMIGLAADGLELRVAPGSYIICNPAVADASCVTARLGPGQTQTVFANSGKAK